MDYKKLKKEQLILLLEAQETYDNNDLLMRMPHIARDAAIKVLLTKGSNPEKEHFILLCLDSQNKIKHSEVVSIGHVSASLVHPREVFKTAIVKGSSRIIVAHNHPSGYVKPSESDNKVTQNLKDCGELLGIGLTDHIIFNYINKNYYSYNEEGEL